ncbi:MAG: HAD family hydrolase [Pseudomonadota bacterium]
MKPWPLVLICSSLTLLTFSGQLRSSEDERAGLQSSQSTRSEPLSRPDLYSWHETDTLASITAFVTQISDEDSASYVPPEARIAVFDNDGTLWAEQPAYFQVLFAADRAMEQLKQRPSLAGESPYRELATGGLPSVVAGGRSALGKLLFNTHAGMSTEDFAEQVTAWLTTAKHPTYNRAFDELTYQPMRELLTFLRNHEFETWIVSGGGVAFMRVWAEAAYGIPADQIIGSRVKLKYDPDRRTNVRQGELLHLNDGPGKPVAIEQIIGARPILAVGNSDGDYEMLDYVTSGTGPRLGVIVRHTDPKREWKYDRQSSIGRLDRALTDAAEKNWLVVDMEKDWRQVFTP